jgi:hypothetical protein
MAESAEMGQKGRMGVLTVCIGLLGFAYQCGFWSHFSINFLEYADFKDVVTSALYPVGGPVLAGDFLAMLLGLSPLFVSLLLFEIATRGLSERNPARNTRTRVWFWATLVVISVIALLLSKLGPFSSIVRDVLTGLLLAIFIGVLTRRIPDVVEPISPGTQRRLMGLMIAGMVLAVTLSFGSGAVRADQVQETFRRTFDALCATPPTTSLLRRGTNLKPESNPGTDHVYFLGKLGDHLFFLAIDPGLRPDDNIYLHEALLIRDIKELPAIDLESCVRSETRRFPIQFESPTEYSAK